MTDWSLGSSDISLMLDISVWDISGKKKSRFGLVAEPSVAIIVILSMEIAGIVILMSVTSGSVAAPINPISYSGFRQIAIVFILSVYLCFIWKIVCR